jgi:hypothetical protein
MPAYPGPTANLPGYTRRSGRSGTVWENGRMRGEVVQVDWNVNIAQIPVVITGSWRTEQKPGGEERVGTFMVQDVDDHWALRVYRFIVARRSGDRSAAFFPEFSIVTQIDDIGAPRASTQHGRESLLTKMAELAADARVPAGELSRMLRLYGVEVERARSIAAETGQDESGDLASGFASGVDGRLPEHHRTEEVHDGHRASNGRAR